MYDDFCHKSIVEVEIIKFKQQRMGSICVHKQEGDNLNYNQPMAEIRVIDITELKTVKFQFTCRRVISRSGDLLVLFMNHNIDIKRNDHFELFRPQANKLEQYAYAYLEAKNLKDQFQQRQLDFITFDIEIPTLNFNKVSILFCDVWKQENHNDASFRKVLRNYFESLKEYNFKSVVITEFELNLGVHLQRGVKRVMREIVKMPTKPDLIQFACLSQQSKEVFMEGTNKEKQDLIKSFTSSLTSTKTDYF